MKKIFIFLIALLPICANAQMNNWERFKYSEINHPFTDVPAPDPTIDNQGYRWVLSKKSLWRIKGTDTTKFENFPNVGDNKNVTSSFLALLDGSAAFIHYSGSIEEGFITYLGYCDGKNLRFFSDSIMEVSLNNKYRPGIIMTKKYVWLVKSNKLIRFDKGNSFKEFVMSEDDISNHINIPVVKTDFFLAEADQVPYIFHDTLESWEKIMLDDTLRGILRVTSNAIYMLGKKETSQICGRPSGII